MFCLMYCYYIHPCLLDNYQESFVYPREVCDHNTDPANGIGSSKAVDLSIINAHYLLHFIGEMICILVMTIPIKNIASTIASILDE